MNSIDYRNELKRIERNARVSEEERTNRTEFTAKVIRRWLNRVGVKTLFIEPGSPWENGYMESSNGKLRDELLNRGIFATFTEAKVLIEQWRREFNQVRLHSSLDYQPPAPVLEYW